MQRTLNTPQEEVRWWRGLLVPLVAYAAATVWFTWPLASVARDHVVSSSGALLNDLYLILWASTWVGHALLVDPLHLFDGNALHPTPHVIAGSEHFLGSMPLFLPVWLATDDAVLALNVTILASFVLAALAMHVLARRWTGSTAAAWVAGAAFAFAPWRADLGRPHLLQVQYLPLIAYGLDRVASGARPRAAWLTAAALAIQVLCSYYLGYAAYVLAGTFVAVWAAAGGWRAGARTWRGLAIALAAPLVVVGPVSIPYMLQRARGGLAVAISDPLLKLWKTLGGPLAVLSTYAGPGVVALGAAGLVAAWAAARRSHMQAVRTGFLAATVVVALVLAAGPAGILGGWLSPYSWLVAVVPGFRSLRSPVRFGVLAGFSLSVLAAYAIAAAERTLRARAGRGALVAASLLGVVVAVGWLVAAPPHYLTYAVPMRDDLPPAYRWLAVHGEGGALLELPIDPMLELGSARAMFVSTYHWLPLINGYTGYEPPASAFLLAQAQQLPAQGSLQILVDCADLEWVLVHRQNGVRRAAWRRMAGVEPLLLPPDATGDDGGEVYRVSLPRRAACPGLLRGDVTARGNAIAAIEAPRGRLTVTLPPRLRQGREQRIDVSLANEGDLVWPGTAVDARRRFQLAYQWQRVDGGAPTGWRTILLPDDVAPGARLDVDAWLTLPRGPGDYVLRFRAGQGDDPRAPLLSEQVVRFDKAG